MDTRWNSYYWSPVGWLARFESGHYEPLEKWDSDGNPMVVDDRSSKLVKAQLQPGFAGLVRSPRVLATVPSQPGWYVRYTDDENPEHHYEVAAWVVLADNDIFARPLAAAEGADLPIGDENAVIIPPAGGWQPETDQT